jgi:hypothetical protein
MPRTKKDASIAKRHPLSMRTTLDIKRRLERAAATNGRSIAQEVENRLERSFVYDEALTSPEIRDAVLRMAAAFSIAGSGSAMGKGLGGLGEWLNDADCYRAAMFSVLDALLMGSPDMSPEAIKLSLEALKSRAFTRFASQRSKDNAR